MVCTMVVCNVCLYSYNNNSRIGAGKVMIMFRHNAIKSWGSHMAFWMSGAKASDLHGLMFLGRQMSIPSVFLVG